MPATIETRVAEFGRHASPGSWFLAEERDIEAQIALLPYSHYLRQAWNQLSLGGVLCVDGRPTVYLCAAAHFTHQQKRDYHRFVWNQGLVPLLVFLTPNNVEVHSTVKEPEKEPASGELFTDGNLSSLIPVLGKVAETSIDMLMECKAARTWSSHTSCSLAIRLHCKTLNRIGLLIRPPQRCLSSHIETAAA